MHQIYQKTLYLVIALALFVAVAETKMVYTFSMIRHGADYPTNDLYDGNETKQFRGQLTPVGLRQQYNLGTYLKQNYITQEKLTTPKFDPTHLEFFSTSIKRTHYSALAFIYGFYPLGQGWTIPPEVPADKLNPPYTALFPQSLKKEDINDEFALDGGFQALPVRTLDTILNDCPTYDQLMSKRRILVASQIRSFEEKYKSQISRMKALFKLTDSQTNLDTMSDLYQTVIADLNLGRKMPEEFTETDLKNLKHMNDLFKTLIFNGDFAKVISTPTIRMFILRCLGIKDGFGPKLSFLFGHQSNLHPLVTLFNLTNIDCLVQKYEDKPITSLNCVEPPQFSANMVMELHQTEDKASYFVKIRYNGYYVNLCEKRSTQCDYKEFIERMYDTQGDFEEACGFPNEKDDGKDETVAAEE